MRYVEPGAIVVGHNLIDVGLEADPDIRGGIQTMSHHRDVAKHVDFGAGA